MRSNILLGFLLFAVAATTVGCLEPEEQGVTYENETSAVLTVMIDDFFLTTLQPGESEAFQVRENLLPDRVRAFDEEGNLVFDEVFTWEDLEANDFRVLIHRDAEGPSQSR